MRNALIVGGTGMLAGLAVRLIEEDWQVGVIGRNAQKFTRITSQLSEQRLSQLLPIRLDYFDRDRLLYWIEQFPLMFGPIDLVVAWIHQPSQDVIQTLIDGIAQYQRQVPGRFIRVFGHRGRPGKDSIKFPQGLNDRTVVLGFVETDSGRRWLTDEEIVQGVYRAALGTSAHTVWGQI